MNKAAKVLGVANSGLISDVNSATVDNLTANPIHAIALAKILENPARLSGGATMQDFIDLATNTLTGLGYSEGEPLTGAAKIEVLNAVDKVIGKQTEIKSAPESAIAGIKEKVQKQRTDYVERVKQDTEKAITAHKDNVLKGIKQNMTFKHEDAEYALLADNKDATTFVEHTIRTLIAV